MSNALSHSHQQTIFVEEDELVAIREEVDTVIERSLLTGTPEPAMSYGRAIVRSGVLKGIRLAKLLYELRAVWESFDSDDDIEDVVLKDMGVPKDTFLKYSRMYEHVLLPHPELAGKPMDGLIKITAAAKDGDFNESDWTDLLLAHDKAAMLAVRDRARDVLERGPRRLVIIWERDGRVTGRRGDGDIEECFHMPKPTGNEVVDAVVERVVRCCGIIER